MDDSALDLEQLFFDSSKRTVDMATAVIGDNPEIFKKVLNFALKDKDPFSMRSARTMNQAAILHPELFQPYIRDLVMKMDDFKSIGLRRSLAKTFFEGSFEMDEDVLGILTDNCFKYLNDPSEEIALKAYSMDVLYKITESYPELKQELISSIENLMPHASVGIKSRGKRLLKKLYKEINR